MFWGDGILLQNKSVYFAMYRAGSGLNTSCLLDAAKLSGRTADLKLIVSSRIGS
jgi:hypothetical protein